MEVTAWNNGANHASGAGYGLKVARTDRDRFFRKTWKSVVIVLPNDDEFDVNIAKGSFWGDTCRELISRNLGQWLIRNGYAPWPKCSPPKFELSPEGDNRFSLGRSET